MNWPRVWVLRGANVWARCPMLEVELDLGGTDLSAVPGATGRLRGWLPGLDAPGEGEPGLALAWALCRLTLALQRQAGCPVTAGVVRPARPGVFRVAAEFEEEALGLACLEAARRLCLAALGGGAPDVQAELSALRELGHDVRLGPSTAAIVAAARGRGIPARRLNDGNLVQLGHAARQRRIWTAETDRTGAIAEAIAQDKDLTRDLLRGVGVPVPRGRPVADAADAWAAAEEIGPPVVVKPRYGNHGRGVATDLRTRGQVEAAFAAASAEGEGVVVERFVPGSDYRMLVIGGRLVAAALREPPQVIGDGCSTVAELVAALNRDPRRSDGHATALSFVKLDAVALAVLAEQGHSPESVPAAGERVLIRRNANLSSGGTAADVTDTVHPRAAASAVAAARAVGLDIAGVDVVAPAIDVPLEESGGAVVEVNAGPGLRMHLEPSSGEPRPVGEAVVGLLLPEGQDGRIPLAAVTGVNGKTTTTRLLAHVLAVAGHHVGMACTDGLYVAGRRIDSRDCSGPRSAQALLLNPRVTAAVLETARGGILREGLGFDRCDVAVVTNIGTGDHLGLRGVESVEDLARVKRTVVAAVSPSGSAVLNAGDPLVAAMALACPGTVIYFARAENETVARHLAAGGRAVLARGGRIVFLHGGRQEALMPLASVPMTHGGRVGFQVENVLAAAAAAWSLGLPVEAVQVGLGSFRGDARQVPGRFNVRHAGGATVIVDYAHNPSALAALVAALGEFPHDRRTLVFAANDRRDADVLAMGAVVGAGFDRVLLYRDRGNGDRRDGELNGLLRRGMSGRRAGEVVELEGEREAIEVALADLRPGDLVVLGVEDIEGSLAAVEAALGPAESAELTFAGTGAPGTGA